MKRIWVSIAAGVALLAAAPIVAADGSESSNVAKCDKAIIGSGPADWRLHSATAGPVGVWKPPLGKMWKTGGQLYTKMGLLVAGHAAVKVSVPPALRERVFLYYGRYRDRNGHPTTLFTSAPASRQSNSNPAKAGRERSGPAGFGSRAPTRFT